MNYGYDPSTSLGAGNLYRLTNETIASDPHAVNGAASYVYDAVGNRTQKTLTLAGFPGGLTNYNANDQIATDTYDANGNTTQSLGTGYLYDFENRLVQAGAGISYVYDGDGNRVSKTANGVTTTYVVDTLNPTGYAQVLVETPSNGPTASYFYGLELAARYRRVSTPEGGVDEYRYYVYDGHGSVRALTDQTGAITDTYDYDAFGNLLNSSFTGTAATPNNYLFAGEQFDPDLGLYYNRARYLNVSTGRFWSTDTDAGDTFDPSSLHKYLYTGDDPVDRVDPTGHDFDVISTVGALAVQYPLVTMTLVSAGIGGATGCVAGMLDSQSTCKSGFLSGMLLGAVLGPIGGAASPSIRILLGIGMSGWAGYSAYGAAKRGDYGLAVFDVVMALGTGFLTSKFAYSTAFDGSPAVSNEPLPPGWNSNWVQMYGTRGGYHWFDEAGGEWRWHAPDSWHSVGHWDYNPWTSWSSSWQNIYQ